MNTVRLLTKMRKTTEIQKRTVGPLRGYSKSVYNPSGSNLLSTRPPFRFFSFSAVSCTGVVGGSGGCAAGAFSSLFSSDGSISDSTDIVLYDSSLLLRSKSDSSSSSLRRRNTRK